MADVSHWALPVQCELGPSRTWLRSGAIRRLALAGVSIVAYAIAVALFLLLASADSSLAVSILRVLLVLLAVATFAGTVGWAIAAARWLSWSNHGYPPRLRLTPTGIDARYFTEDRYDLSIPWIEMEKISTKRVWGSTYLCISPLGPHRWIPPGADAADTVEKCFHIYGAPFVVDLTFSGVGLTEFDRLLRHYSGGRVRLTPNGRGASANLSG